jgi:hypothetical protein
MSPLRLRYTPQTGFPPEVSHQTRPMPPPGYMTATGPWQVLAARHEPPQPGPVPCRCDDCQDDQQSPPGAGVVLYAGLDGEALRILHGIRDGWLEDIPAYADGAGVRADAGFIAAQRHARRTIESGYRRCVALVLAARQAA